MYICKDTTPSFLLSRGGVSFFLVLKTGSPFYSFPQSFCPCTRAARVKKSTRGEDQSVLLCVERSVGRWVGWVWWMFTGDISQMIVVFNPQEPKEYIDLHQLCERQQWEWKAGLTPPTHRIRSRKFKNLDLFERQEIRDAELQVLEVSCRGRRRRERTWRQRVLGSDGRLALLVLLLAAGVSRALRTASACQCKT